VLTRVPCRCLSVVVVVVVVFDDDDNDDAGEGNGLSIKRRWLLFFLGSVYWCGCLVAFLSQGGSHVKGKK